MTKTHTAVDPDLGAATVPVLAAVYYTLRAAIDVIQAGKNDGRANDITERWLDRITANLDSEIEIAISRIANPPCGDVEDINRLDALIDRANRCGDLEEVARLAASVKRRAA